MIRLRRANLGDAGAAAEIFWQARVTCLPFILHPYSVTDIQAFLEQHVFADCDATIAERSGRPVGFSAAKPGWLEHLYVLPDHHGMGVGSTLLKHAQEEWAHLKLWTFQKNLAARRFYESRGFRLMELTDGSRNMEREPDALYEWRRAKPANGA